MSLDWKFQGSLAHRQHDLMPFLTISLLLHGVLFLGLAIYWRDRNHSPKTEKAVTPVEFIELPANKATVKPPLEAKRRASSNSTAGGKAQRDLPLAAGALEVRPKTPVPARRPNLSQPKASTPRSIQPVPSPQSPQPTPLPSPSPLASTTLGSNPKTPLPARRPNLSQPKASTPRSIQPVPSPQSPQPTPLPSPSPLASTTLESRLKSPLPTHQPNLTQPKASTPWSIQPVRPLQSAPLATSLALTDRTNSHWNKPLAPHPKPNSIRLPPGQASLLGGPISLNSHDFTSNQFNLPNANRPGPDLNGVDARQDSDLGPYLDTLKQQVVRQWPPQATNSFKQTIIIFSVSRTGQLANLHILQPSGSGLIDAAALTAVQRAAPFKPLPTGFPEAQLKIQFKFTVDRLGELDVH